MTENFSGADIEGLVRNALLVSCRKSVQNTQPTISEEDILEALSSYRPSITWEQLCRYDSWKQATY